MTPKVSAFPWDRLPRLSRADAHAQSTIARWIGARGQGDRLARLVGAPVAARVVSPGAADPHAATCVVRRHGADIEVSGSSAGVRAIAQTLLGGPPELPAPRPLGIVEQSIWALVVATALEDLGVAGEVVPRLGGLHARPPVSFAIDLAFGAAVMRVEVRAPSSMPLRVPPVAAPPAWAERLILDLPLVAGRCALHRDDLARLAPRQIVTLDRPTTDSDRRFRAGGELRADLDVFDGAVGVSASAGAVVAEVVTGYVRRDMALPDDAHVELTVSLGTTQLPLRQVLELAVGQIVQLGRPLGGPCEVRAQGRVVGRGELVDVDGELAVRIVSVGDQTSREQ